MTDLLRAFGDEALQHPCYKCDNLWRAQSWLRRSPVQLAGKLSRQPRVHDSRQALHPCFFSSSSSSVTWACVCLCQVEPVGPGHCAPVSDGHHLGGDRDQRCPAHQPHHHPDHESAEDRSRYTTRPPGRTRFPQTLLAPPDADLVRLKTLNGFNRTAVA